MATIVDVESLQVSATAARFEGRDHGSPVSLFVTAHPPGAGVPLHRHPCAETFVVQAGGAEWSAGARRRPSGAVPAAAARFSVASGAGTGTHRPP